MIITKEYFTLNVQYSQMYCIPFSKIEKKIHNINKILKHFDILFSFSERFQVRHKKEFGVIESDLLKKLSYFH